MEKIPDDLVILSVDIENLSLKVIHAIMDVDWYEASDEAFYKIPRGPLPFILISYGLLEKNEDIEPWYASVDELSTLMNHVWTDDYIKALTFTKIDRALMRWTNEDGFYHA